MAQLFGKNYQEAGKSSSPLLLRSNGEIKLQWGNKFIDLIKNGKIASESKEFIQTIDSSDNIQDNGVYLVTSDNSIWINVEGTKVQVSENENSYVSFLAKQELTAEQKDVALTNIGFYYDTLDQINESQIQAGIVYVKDTNKLYLINDGVTTEYQVVSSLPDAGEFKELTVGDISISKDNISATSLTLEINKQTYVQLQNSNIICDATIITNAIKSTNYSQDSGYAIYEKNSAFVLDIDSINWRNIEKELPKNTKDYIKYTILGDYNIVTSVSDESITEDDVKKYIYSLQLKYPNTIPSDATHILAELNTSYNVYLLVQIDNQFSIDKPFPSGCTLRVIYDNGLIEDFSSKDDNTYTTTSTIFKAYFIINGKINYNYVININESKQNIQPTELSIYSVSSNSIQIVLQDDTVSEDLMNNTQFKIYQARTSQFIQGEGFLALRKWDNNKYVYHTIIGTYTESEFGLSDDTSPKFGLYSDDIKVTGISLSGAKFSGDLPEYVEVEPEIIKDSQIPTMGIINKAIKKATDDVGDTNLSLINKNTLPKGSIVMFNSLEDIPEKWHICDGTNGTPNLIDKFIKGGTQLEDSSIELTKYQESATEETQGETNKYILNAYSLIFIMKIK